MAVVFCQIVPSEVSMGNVEHDEAGTFVLPATDQEIHENNSSTLPKLSVCGENTPLGLSERHQNRVRAVRRK